MNAMATKALNMTVGLHTRGRPATQFVLVGLNVQLNLRARHK